MFDGSIFDCSVIEDNYHNGRAKNCQKVAYLRRNPSPSVKWKTIA